MTVEIDNNVRAILLKLQKAETTGSLVYARMATFEKHEKHKAILLEISKDEQRHYEAWRKYTGVELTASRAKLLWYTVLMLVLGYTFVLRIMEKGEDAAVQMYNSLQGTVPEITTAMQDEQRHEEMLINMLDEERLHYVGAIVLGLNDALVELSGAIAGFTFALAHTRMIAMAAIITGIAATLSMATSNYLAEKAEGKAHPFKSALYTGIAYLITVVVLIAPYLLLGNDAYLLAFAIMLVCCVLIIFAFNYYVSVAQKQPLWSRFGQMAAISLGVAAISFVIGIAAKAVLGVDL